MQDSAVPSFNEFLAGEIAKIDLARASVNLLLAAVLATILGFVYVRFGRTATNRRMFAGQFVLISMTTALIIIVVKSSLALSLGLVGALSIVRFRSAVREHEELAYLFLSIAIGLCLGANQTALALVGFALIVAILIIRGLFTTVTLHDNLFLRMQLAPEGENSLEGVAALLAQFCTLVKLKRFEVRNNTLESSFQVEFRSLADLANAQRQLEARFRPLEVSFIDGEGFA
jgi:hypothetical protein